MTLFSVSGNISIPVVGGSSDTFVQATKYKVEDQMRLSIVESYGQLTLMKNDMEKLDNGVQKKYYWKDHEENHNGGRKFSEKMAEFKRLEAGWNGVAVEFSDRNRSGNSRGATALTSTQGNRHCSTLDLFR